MDGLGIDPIQLGAQIVNFTILVYLFKRFLYTPIFTMLDKRKDEIERGLSLEESLTLRKEKIDLESKKMRKEVREEERRVMKQAVLEAKKREKEILEEAKEEIRNEREKMLAEVKVEKEKVYEDAKKQSLNYAVLISEKLLSKKLDAKEQKQLLDQVLSNLGRNH